MDQRVYSGKNLSPINKKINTLFRRFINLMDEKDQRNFNRMADRGGELTKTMYDDAKDKMKTKKLDNRGKKIDRQLQAAFKERENQKTLGKKNKTYKLKKSQLVGRGGGGSMKMPQEYTKKSLLKKPMS